MARTRRIHSKVDERNVGMKDTGPRLPGVHRMPLIVRASTGDWKSCSECTQFQDFWEPEKG
jgi:hypothetical protein